MRVLLLAVSLLALLASGAKGDELIVCGWDEVYVLNVPAQGKPEKMWNWKAAERQELPEAYRSKFRTTDECKPVTGNRILITASSDGIALVDRASGKAQFWAACGNTHSAEVLPGNRIAVACSVRPSNGNRLALFDASVPERELFSTELYSGHGVVWDEQRKTLWALSGKDLRAYALVDWESAKPRLSLTASYPLPTFGGHELTAVDGSAALVVSTEHGVYHFDRDRKTFTLHPTLGKLEHVKSVSIQPGTGKTVYVQADSPEWWSNKIRFLESGRVIELDKERIYKVRWMRK